MQQNTGIECSKEDNDSLVKDMLNKFKDGSLSSVYLKEYWNIWLYKSLPVDWITNIDCGLMESIAEMHSKILEDFICNESKEKLLKREDMCRKFLKLNDFYFSCFDCRSGTRSVMCTNCFRNSTHRFHKYEFGISNEEGLFCDCGIHDAWKCNPYCEEHSKTVSRQFELPLDVASRASFVIESVVKYCVEIWCQNSLPLVPTITEDSEKYVNKNLFCTVLLKNTRYWNSKLYHDINELFESIADGKLFTANMMAKKGMFIICESLNVCCTTKNQLDSLIEEDRLPLRSYICHWHQLAQQAFSFELLSWLPKLVLKDANLREVFLTVVLNNTSQCLDLINGSNKDSLLEIIILNRPSMLWNAAKSVWYNIIVMCILTDYKNKCVFAKIFVKHYASIMNECKLSIHDAPFVGLNTISEHVFAVPSIAKQLVEDENALAILFNIIKTTYSTISSSTGFKGKDDITHNTVKNVLKDIVFLLDFKPEDWSCKLRENFIQGINVYLNALVFLRKIYSLKSLQSFLYFLYLKYLLDGEKKLLAIDTKILRLCSTDKALLIEVYKLTLKTISENLIPCWEGVSFKKLAGHCAQLFSYNSSDEDVQFLCPIGRFFASLYQELQKKSLDYRSPEFTFIVKPTPEQLVDAILKMGVSVVKRNSFIRRQTQQFIILLDFDENLSKEIFVLQIGATLIENNTFLITLLNKFELLCWASEEFDSDTTIEETQETNKDTIEKSVSLGEEFLLLIIYIIGERYNTEISTVTSYECSKYKIFHSLSVYQKQYTQLVSEFPDLDEDEIKNVLNEIATTTTQHEPGQSKSLFYVVNKDLRDSYNKYYCYYKPIDKDLSKEEQQKIRKLLDGIDCCPPPQLCKVKPYYQSLTTLLHCDVMLNIIRAVLNRSLYPRHKGSSKEQLFMTLHLIGYGLWEEENDHGVSFTDNALKWNIETLLERLNCSLHMEYCKDLIQWVLNKFKSVKNKNKPTVVIIDESSKCSEIIKGHYEDKSGRSQRASKSHATIMDKMRSLQKSFFRNNYHTFEKLFEKENRSEESLKIWKCICCQMDDDTSNSNSALVLAAFVQRSRLLTKNQDMLTNWFPAITGDYHSAYVNSCGHVMHVHCLEQYLLTLKCKRHHLDSHEFLCPLCKCMCNTKIPIVSQSYYEDCEISFDLWLQKITAFCGDHKVPMQYDGSYTTDQDDTSKLSADDNKTKEVVFLTLNELVTNENPELSEELIKALTSFILHLSECYKISSSGKDFLLVWQVCAYKICCLERYKFSMGASLLGNISCAEDSCIKNLVNISSMLGIIYQNTLSGSTVIQDILFLLFGRDKIRKTNILKWECFELFFYLNMVLAGCNKFSCLKIHFDKNLFRVILVLNFAKIILNSNIGEFINLDFDNVCDDTRCLVKFVKLFKDCKGINAVELWNFIKESSLPFLNSSCIFYYFLTGKKPSESLEKVEGNTFENVLNYIGLSFGCNELLNSDFIFETISSVAEHPDVRVQRGDISLTSDIVRFNTLFPLPENFYEIIFMAEKYVYPHGNTEPLWTRSKSLCLICGQIFCYNDIIHVGVINGYDEHGIVCPWEIGIFLDIYTGEVNFVSSYFKDNLECTIKLYRIKQDCVIEKFEGRRDRRPNILYSASSARSKPLYLNNKLYSKINKWWLSHSLIEEIRKNYELECN